MEAGAAQCRALGDNYPQAAVTILSADACLRRKDGRRELLPRSLRCGVLVDILLLRIMQPDQSLYRFDNPLRIADEITAGILDGSGGRNAAKQPRQMLNFTVCAAHGGKTG